MNWWSRLVRRKRMEEQLEKELRFHLDQHAGDLIARGGTPEDARRQARLSLGGLEQVKENCRDARGTRWLEDLARDTRYAFRTFSQKPGFAAIAVMILALGIGATTVMFAVVHSVLLKPLSFPDSDRLVTVHGYSEQLGDFWGMSHPDLNDLRRESRSLAIAAWTYGGGTISEPGEPHNLHNVLTARFALSPSAVADPSQIQSAWQDVLDRARRVPGVEFAALTDIVPMGAGVVTLPYRTTAAPLPANEQPVALASCVTPDYLKVMGIPLLEGRFFTEHDREGSELLVVIDENLARRAFGEQRAAGRHLWIPAMGNAPVQVVGVVGHVRHWGLARDDQARVRDQMYYSFSQVPVPLLRFISSFMSITVRTKTQPLNVVEPLQFELRGPARDQALYEIRTMEQIVSASLARHRFLLYLFGVFAGIALILASTGIYGVLAYLTGQRIPEIGLRMALGATVGDVMALVLRQCLRMALGGIALGILAALAAGRVLQGLVQGMQPVHAATFAIMITVLLAAAVASGFVPALRASRIDPVRALRQE